MRTTALLPVALFGTLVAACVAEAPARPSWDQDVLPILQGSCNQCHGATVGQVPRPDGTGNLVQPLTRMDFCSPGQLDTDLQALVPLGATGAIAFLKATEGQGSIRGKGGARASMPPPPALELSSYEIDVLLNWVRFVEDDRDGACRKQSNNRRPSARLVGQPRQDGSDLIVTIDVNDLDHDGVVGKLRSGTNEGNIRGAGRQVVRIAGARQGEALSVRLHDGYDKAEFNLD